MVINENYNSNMYCMSNKKTDKIIHPNTGKYEHILMQ